MKKIVIGTLVTILTVFIVIGIVKDQIGKAMLTTAVKEATGAPVSIDNFSFGIFSQSIQIAGFKIYNPEGFSKNVLVELSTINITYDVGALLKKRIHLPNAEIELKELALEKNKEGKLNVDSLKVAQHTGKQEGHAAQGMPIKIDFLTLGIEKVIVKDYASGKEPVVKAYDINIHKNYKNITSIQQLTALILAEPMKAAGIKGAKIYGAAMLAGVGVLPVAVAGAFLGKDYARQDFEVSFDTLYQESLSVVKQMGKITSQDKYTGAINGVVNSAQVNIKIMKKENNKTEITVSARKYLFPKPEIAGGVLYEISQKIK